MPEFKPTLLLRRICILKKKTVAGKNRKKYVGKRFDIEIKYFDQSECKKHNSSAPKSYVLKKCIEPKHFNEFHASHYFQDGKQINLVVFKRLK